MEHRRRVQPGVPTAKVKHHQFVPSIGQNVVVAEHYAFGPASASACVVELGNTVSSADHGFRSRCLEKLSPVSAVHFEHFWLGGFSGLESPLGEAATTVVNQQPARLCVIYDCSKLAGCKPEIKGNQ